MTEIQIDVRPTGIESAIVYAPFDKAKETLENKGYRIISLEENAKLRIQQGNISRNGNWTREAFIYDKQRGSYLTKNSPIMLNAKEATQSHRNGNEYFLTQKQIDESLIDAIKVFHGTVPTNRFKDNDVTAFVFGNVAEDYGKWLDNEAGIKEMPFFLANFCDKPFARQMWFWDLGCGSGLDGINWVLGDGNRMRGVKEIK